MRSLTIQVQPARSPDLDMSRLCAAFDGLASESEFVQKHQFTSGDDSGLYFNFIFETSRPRDLWTVIRDQFYASGEFGFHMARASMAMCSSEAGWNDYDLLFHFDPTVPRDVGPAV